MTKQYFTQIFVFAVYLISCFLADGFTAVKFIKHSEKHKQSHSYQYEGSEETTVVGSWTLWGPWSCCAGECGNLGYQIRRRMCIKFLNSKYDFHCIGKSLEYRGCHLAGCQPHHYEKLVANDPLRLNEYKYLQSVHNQIPALIPRCLVADCRFDTVHHMLGDDSDRYWNALQCVKHDVGCPVVGEWGDWAVWSRCSAWCGNGKRFRCRYCNKPVPSSPELRCHGDNCTFEKCHGTDCALYPGSWSSWSEWSPCSATCGYGIIRRYRKCVVKLRRDLKKNVLRYFRGKTIKTKLMDRKLSSVTEAFREKKSFHGSTCGMTTATSLQKNTSTKSCASSSSKPLRETDVTLNANDLNTEKIKTDCIGPHEIIKPCYLQDCVLDGGWSDWSAWTACSADCGQGTQMRTRACSNPPAEKGGNPCPGPITWIRHCYQIPCEVKVHEVLLLSGNSILRYSEPLHPSSQFHLYMKFKLFDINGDLLHQFTRGCSNFKHWCDSMLLKIENGRLLFTAQLSHCKTMINSSAILQLNVWHEVLLTITGNTARLRIDDDYSTARSFFSCRLPLKTFNYAMEIGNKFKGMLQWTIINFTPVGMHKVTNGTPGVNPVEVLNVEPVTVPVEDSFINLDQLIRVPCPGNNSNWEIEIALIPETTIGLLLFMRGTEPSDYLVITLEMNRVRLFVHVNDETVEAEEPEEIHPNKWLYIVVNKREDGSIGLKVNGGHRHSLVLNTNSNDLMDNVTCSSAILLGQMPLKLKMELSREVPHVIPVSSVEGKLGIVKINDKLFDLHILNRQSQTHSKMYSSYSASITDLYEELVLIKEKSLNLKCFYDHAIHNIYPVRNCSINTVWSNLDTPIVKSPDERGVHYEVEDTRRMTTLKLTSFPSRDAVEGFYSCWVHKPITGKPEENFVTFGILLLDVKKDYSLSNFTKFVIISKIIFGVCLFVWVIYYLIRDVIKGHGFWKSEILKRDEKIKRVKEMISSKEGSLLLGSEASAIIALDRVANWGEFELESLRTIKDKSLQYPLSSEQSKLTVKTDPDLSYYSSPRESVENVSSVRLSNSVPKTSPKVSEQQNSPTIGSEINIKSGAAKINITDSSMQPLVQEQTEPQNRSSEHELQRRIQGVLENPYDKVNEKFDSSSPKLNSDISTTEKGERSPVKSALPQKNAEDDPCQCKYNEDVRKRCNQMNRKNDSEQNHFSVDIKTIKNEKPNKLKKFHANEDIGTGFLLEDLSFQKYQNGKEFFTKRYEDEESGIGPLLSDSDNRTQDISYTTLDSGIYHPSINCFDKENKRFTEMLNTVQKTSESQYQPENKHNIKNSYGTEMSPNSNKSKVADRQEEYSNVLKNVAETNNDDKDRQLGMNSLLEDFGKVKDKILTDISPRSGKSICTDTDDSLVSLKPVKNKVKFHDKMASGIQNLIHDFSSTGNNEVPQRSHKTRHSLCEGNTTERCRNNRNNIKRLPISYRLSNSETQNQTEDFRKEKNKTNSTVSSQYYNNSDLEFDNEEDSGSELNKTISTRSLQKGYLGLCHLPGYYTDGESGKTPKLSPRYFRTRDSSLETVPEDSDVTDLRSAKISAQSYKNHDSKFCRFADISEVGEKIDTLISPRSFKTGETSMSNLHDDLSTIVNKTNKITTKCYKTIGQGIFCRTEEFSDGENKIGNEISSRTFKTKDPGTNNRSEYTSTIENKTIKTPDKFNKTKVLGKRYHPDSFINLGNKTKVEPIGKSFKRKGLRINYSPIGSDGLEYKRTSDVINGTSTYYGRRCYPYKGPGSSIEGIDHSNNSYKKRITGPYYDTADDTEKEETNFLESEYKEQISSKQNHYQSYIWNVPSKVVKQTITQKHSLNMYSGEEQRSELFSHTRERKLNKNHPGEQSSLSELYLQPPNEHDVTKQKWKSDEDKININDTFSKKLLEVKRNLKPVYSSNLNYAFQKQSDTTFSNTVCYHDDDMNQNDYENDIDTSLSPCEHLSEMHTLDSRDSSNTELQQTRRKFCAVMLERMSLPYDVTGGGYTGRKPSET